MSRWLSPSFPIFFFLFSFFFLLPRAYSESFLILFFRRIFYLPIYLSFFPIYGGRGSRARVSFLLFYRPFPGRGARSTRTTTFT